MGHSKTWTELDEQDQKDLIEWLNVSKPDAQDKARLAELFSDGRFSAWSCPGCDKRVFYASPEEWGHFQGVCQLDYTSYPGDSEKYSEAYLQKLCDTCRCHGPEKDRAGRKS